MLLSSLLFIVFIGIPYILGYMYYIGLNSSIQKNVLYILYILSILILVFNAWLVYFFYSYLADYFIQNLPIGKFKITIIFFGFLWWTSFLSMMCFPPHFENTRTLFGTLHHCLYFLFSGFSSNLFKSNDDNLKTILNNSGGSPQLVWAWSDLPLSKFAGLQLVAVFFVFIELRYGNIFNESKYIPINSNESMKYTYGLVILVTLSVIVTIVFSRSGNRVQRLFLLWFTMGFFQSFLGDKMSAVLNRNIFTDLSTSSLVSIIPSSSKDKPNNSSILFGKNKDKQYRIKKLPVHVFFLALGRIFQVCFFILISVLSLLLFGIFVIVCFCLIVSYIDASQFGDGTISFFEVLKSLPYKSVNFSFDAIRSKLIVDTPTEWIFQKIHSFPNVNWAEEVSKVNSSSLSSGDVKSNELILKEMPAETRSKIYFAVSIIIFIVVVSSMANGNVDTAV